MRVKEEEYVIYIDSPITKPYSTYIFTNQQLPTFHSQYISQKLQIHQNNSSSSFNNIKRQVQDYLHHEHSSRNKGHSRSHCKGIAHIRKFSAPEISQPTNPINLLATGKALKTRLASSTLKRPIRNTLSCRSEPYTQSQHFLSPARSSSSIRPQTVIQKKPIKSDHLMIYPFQCKLKTKRVDDNPKILQQIIALKHRNNRKE